MAIYSAVSLDTGPANILNPLQCAFLGLNTVCAVFKTPYLEAGDPQVLFVGYPSIPTKSSALKWV